MCLNSTSFIALTEGATWEKL